MSAKLPRARVAGAYRIYCRYCNSYDGDNLEIVTPPNLKDGERIHYCIFQDESCIHANDQSMYIWQEEGIQPLRSKDRGRISHCSDFIYEQGGRLYLTPDEIVEQNKLPIEPSPPAVSDVPRPTKGHTPKRRKGAPKETAGRRTLERPDGWVPPPPPAPHKSYRLRTYDARRIIYPGANYDPWWDMKQLIAQVSKEVHEVELWPLNLIAAGRRRDPDLRV